MIKRQFYGWFDPRRRKIMLSYLPPDAPVRPALPFSSRHEATEYVSRKRGKVLWLPELPTNIDDLVA